MSLSSKATIYHLTLLLLTWERIKGRQLTARASIENWTAVNECELTILRHLLYVPHPNSQDHFHYSPRGSCTGGIWKYHVTLFSFWWIEGGRNPSGHYFLSVCGATARPSTTETRDCIKPTISCPQRQIVAPQALIGYYVVNLLCFPQQGPLFNSLLIWFPVCNIHLNYMKNVCHILILSDYFHCWLICLLFSGFIH